MAPQFPIRRPWEGFPLVPVLLLEATVKNHPFYAAAKNGDPEAAWNLVNDLMTPDMVHQVKDLIGEGRPFLLPIHALEEAGINEIPIAMADYLGKELDLPVWTDVFQANKVGHTGARGFARLARQAVFSGEVQSGGDYLILDDFLGMGGTIANARGYMEEAGAHVRGALCLTGKGHSSTVALCQDTLDALRRRHGKDLEPWWEKAFGFDFPALTESEARYLLGHDVDAIRSRLAEAGLEAVP